MEIEIKASGINAKHLQQKTNNKLNQLLGKIQFSIMRKPAQSKPVHLNGGKIQYYNFSYKPHSNSSFQQLSTSASLSRQRGHTQLK